MIATPTSPWQKFADLLDPPQNPCVRDPVGWVSDRFGEFLWSKQREILEAVVRHRYVAVKSAHDTGKSHSASEQSHGGSTREKTRSRRRLHRRPSRFTRSCGDAADIARFGEDETLIMRREGGWIRVYPADHKADTMVTAGHIAKAMRDIDDEAGKNDWVHAVVDVPGVGGGVVDRLAELELPVVPYNGGEAPIDKERFVNARAEDYWTLRERFEQGEIDIDPDDDKFAAQLGSIKWGIDSRGRIKIESKEDMRKRGICSADQCGEPRGVIPPPDWACRPDCLPVCTSSTRGFQRPSLMRQPPHNFTALPLALIRSWASSMLDGSRACCLRGRPPLVWP